MKKSTVAIVRYEKPGESVRNAVDLSGGLDRMPEKAKVFIKPNIVFWTRLVAFPKYGVITTSRVVEDMVVLLKERGIDDITIGEGIVTFGQDRETPAHAFESLGYNRLNERYGVKAVSIFERPFREVDLGNGETLNFNEDILESDFVVDIPVLKTHVQAMVSLGIKNLKGTIDVESRKKCHNADENKDLDYWVARLADPMPPVFTLIDGIYTLERGPSFDGYARRKNILVASADPLSADLVGARVLGKYPADIPHLALAAAIRERPTDLSDLDVVGEKIEDVAEYHEHAFPFTEDLSLPAPMEKMGIKGLSYYKYDSTLCTYCSVLYGVVLTSIAKAWKGEPWDDVEILTGKRMQPRPEKNKTILLGKCMCDLHKDNPDIREKILVKGCPPPKKLVVKALHQAGIMIDPSIIDALEAAPGNFMRRYEGKPGFEEALYTVE